MVKNDINPDFARQDKLLEDLRNAPDADARAKIIGEFKAENKAEYNAMLQRFKNFKTEDGEYLIPVEWKVRSVIQVSGTDIKNISDAFDKVISMVRYRPNDMPTTADTEYVKDSYNLDGSYNYDELIVFQGQEKTGSVHLTCNDGDVEFDTSYRYEPYAMAITPEGKPTKLHLEKPLSSIEACHEQFESWSKNYKILVHWVETKMFNGYTDILELMEYNDNLE